MSLRRRLFVRVFIPVAAMYFVVALLGAFQVRSELIDNLDDDLRLAAAGSSVVLAPLTTDEIGLVLAETDGTPTPRLSAIVEVDTGKVLVSPLSRFGEDEPNPAPEMFEPQRLAPDVGQPFEMKSNDGSLTYRAVTTRIDGGRLLVLAEPIDRINDIFGGLVVGIVTIGLLILAALAVVLYLTVRSSLKPLDGFIAATTEIAEGDLSQRVPIGSDPTSVRIATATNHMLDRVEAGYEEQRLSPERLHGLITDVSHELRTPLTGIRGAVDMQRMGMMCSEEATTSTFRQLDHHSSRMVEIVEDLLVIARVEQGLTNREHDQSATIAEVLVAAVDETRSQTPGRDITLVAGDPAVVVDIDAQLLTQAVGEVLDNAVRHTPAGTPIAVAMRQVEDQVLVEVTDHGLGIPPEIQPRIFDRFVRADPSRNRSSGGSGLGLAIARSICQSAGGSITLRCSDTSGTTFELCFPAQVPSPQLTERAGA